MNAKRLAGILLTLTFLISGVSSATDYVNCSGCTQLQMANAALAHGVGRVLVGNLPANNLIAFRVYQGSQPLALASRLSAANPSNATAANHLFYDWDDLSTEEISAFAAYYDLYLAAGGTAVTIDATLTLSKAASVGPGTAYLLAAARPSVRPMDVSSDGNINAFDVVSTPVYRDRVASQINGLAIQGWPNLPNNVHLQIVRVLNFVGIGKIISSPITMIVNVRFADGTQSSFHWNSTTNSWTYTPGSSKDLSGNPIPDTAQAAAGAPNASEQNYIFPPNVYGASDGANQVDNLHRLGIPIDVPVHYYGSAWGIACVTSGTKGPTVCHPYLIH